MAIVYQNVKFPFSIKKKCGKASFCIEELNSVIKLKLYFQIDWQSYPNLGCVLQYMHEVIYSTMISISLPFEWLTSDGLVLKHNRPVQRDGRNVNCNR